MEPSIYSSAPSSEGAVRRASFLHHCCQTQISISREYKTHWTLRRYIYNTLLTYLPWTTGHSPVVLLTLKDTSDISIWINASYGDCETHSPRHHSTMSELTYCSKFLPGKEQSDAPTQSSSEWTLKSRQFNYTGPTGNSSAPLKVKPSHSSACCSEAIRPTPNGTKALYSH